MPRVLNSGWLAQQKAADGVYAERYEIQFRKEYPLAPADPPKS